MPIYFKDDSEDIEFEYYDSLPSERGKLNTHLLKLYWLYRNSIYDSYKKKDLAEDIQKRKPVYAESKDASEAVLKRYNNPLHHYTVAASLDTMKMWKNPTEKMHCYIAYQNHDGKKIEIGFVHFCNKMLNEKSVVYIAQAGVLNRGKGIGRRLMELILAHYPAGTEFYILTRVFNTDAKILYGDRLKFTPIDESEIKKLNYDSRYCGYKHTTSPENLAEIKAKLASDKTSDIKRKHSDESEAESENVKSIKSGP